MIPWLPDEVRALFPFEPCWAEVAGYRLHYLDEGERGAPCVVLLHGNPTWSFLYRDILPPIAAAGFRVIAPDYLGFGRSDHARYDSDYAIAHHIGRTLAVLRQAGVGEAVLFCQDWGGPIGLGLELAQPGFVRGLVLANTFWGEASIYHHRVFPWRTLHGPLSGPLLLSRRRMFVNGIRLSGPPSVQDGPAWTAYTLPFDYHAGPGGTLAFPRAISLGEGHPTQPLADALWQRLATLDVPVRFVWGDADVVFPPKEQGTALRDRLPRGHEHPIHIVSGGRHFVQEYDPQACADACIRVAEEAYR
jgi:haloalkane dehalogenase